MRSTTVTDAERYALLAGFLTEHRRELFERIAAERTRHITLVLEDIYQPHNASAVVRTAELLGVQDLHIIENRNSYKVNPEVTLGSSKWTDMHRYRERGADNSLACARHLKARGYALVATVPGAGAFTPDDIPLDRPLAFCFGTELTGLTPALCHAADLRLRIPMHGFTESYNISVAAAIVLYTVMQRLRCSDVPWRLSSGETDAMKLAWARRSVRSAGSMEDRWFNDAASEQGGNNGD